MPSNITPDKLAAAMQDPAIQRSSPDNLISNLMAMFGMEDLEAVSSEESESIRHTYFQAYKLEKDKWAELPGGAGIVQIMPYKLKELPPNGMLVADVLIDKTDFEAEVFDRYITNMSARGKAIIFYSNGFPPVDVTIGLKCVDKNTGEAIFIPDNQLQKA